MTVRAVHTGVDAARGLSHPSGDDGLEVARHPDAAQAKTTMTGTTVHALLRSDPRVFRDARSIIAESIWWNPSGALEWCDIDAGVIHSSPLDGPADGSADRLLELPPPIAAFQPADEGYVVADLDSVFLVGADGSNRRTLARVEYASGGIRFNEAKCDPFGQFVVGSMEVMAGDRKAAIYVVTAEGGCRVLIDGIGVANGFEWSDDGGTMWFTDTATETIFVGDYDGNRLENVRTFASGRASDGLARDADGGFWNGINDIGHVVHWTADGEVDLEFDVPAGHVTSVGFGGADLSTLFIATAREKLTEQQLVDEPLTGSIFAVETATHGFPARRFGSRIR
ncbi:MAG TPA: SMP-30/gluconolactonase/LRE family protein [Galbitalea sp.]